MFTVELASSVTTSMYTHSGTTPHGFPDAFFTTFAVTTASREDPTAGDPDTTNPTAANTQTAASRLTPETRYLSTPTTQPYCPWRRRTSRGDQDGAAGR